MPTPDPAPPTCATAMDAQPTTSIGKGVRLLRAVFDLTVDMAYDYGDNLHHCKGEQADRQFARIVAEALKATK